MKITDVTATLVDLGPIPNPTRDATVAATRGSFGMVEVFTDEGLTGICPSPANPEYVEHTLKPRMLGENPLDYERIWHKLQLLLRNPPPAFSLPVTQEGSDYDQAK